MVRQQYFLSVLNFTRVTQMARVPYLKAEVEGSSPSPSTYNKIFDFL